MVILKSVDTFAVNLSDVLFISKNSKSLISTSILGHPNQEQLAERVRLLQKELQETKRLMGKVDDAENSQS
ncbi:MAG: hypothetical protein PUF38_03360 [Bacteroidales bacterium]|nr:hypothetical protein [Bacteroidales bacterium]